MTLRTTRITVETESLTILRRATVALGWCPGCQGEVEIVRLANESLADPATGAQIQQWSDTGKLHLAQAADGCVQLCVKSLLTCFEIHDLKRVGSRDEDGTARTPGNK